MATIIEYFIKEFVPSLPDSYMVNISDLVDQINHTSPLHLPYNNRVESIQNLSAAILVNFCSTYRDVNMVHKTSIQKLKAIIEPSSDSDDDAVARKILLVHISKRPISIDLLRFLLVKAQSMVVKVVIPEDEKNWIRLANKVIRHKQINDIIENCIKDFGLTLNGVDEGAEPQIKITIVEKGPTFLRGFVGFEEIFIHSRHFQEKINSFEGDIDLLQLLCKMDIISVVLHDLAHLKMRKCVGQFNFHTPALATESGIGAIGCEFGSYAEHKLFNGQVDWFNSSETVDTAHIDSFINAIENQTHLPTGYIEGTLFRCGMPNMGGSDIQLNYYLC